TVEDGKRETVILVFWAGELDRAQPHCRPVPGRVVDGRDFRVRCLRSGGRSQRARQREQEKNPRNGLAPHRIIITTFRSRPPSNSQRKIPCQRPSSSLPSAKGTVTLGPTR